MGHISEISIPRYLACLKPLCLQIHVFSDASGKAFGTCCYMRYKNEDGWESHLIYSKAKVMPLQRLTIPKLELMAATEGALAFKKLRNTNTLLENAKIFMWTDSMAVLEWIRGSKQWPIFVENRVRIIRDLNLVDSVYYVNTKENPADLLSRGVKAVQLHNCNLWWHGPAFLRNDIQDQQLMNNTMCSENLTTEPSCSFITTVQGSEVIEDLLIRYSSYDRLLNVTAYVLRALHNFKFSGAKRLAGPLTLEDIKNSETLLFKHVQKIYPNEHKVLVSRDKGGVNKRIPQLVFQLNLFLDNDSIIRVDTRLQNSSFQHSSKQPVLLPVDSPLTKLLITKSHHLVLHGGVNQTLAHLRLRFWIVKGRAAVKRV